MPELPEVETIRGQLTPHLEGRTFTSVEIRDYRWTLPADPGLIAAELTCARVEKLSRLGKYMIWELDQDRYLIVHLRMTGALLFNPDPDTRHVSVVFELDNGSSVVYTDPRRFGTGHLLFGRETKDAYLAKRLGVEPFTPEFTAEYLRAQARGRTAPVKSFILDQRRIAGIGNIYADEALHRAGVHPLRPAGQLTLPQWRRMKDAIETALQAGIDSKGASIDDYRHVDGARGTFQDSFLVHTRVGEPCPDCGHEIRKLVVGGRGTYVCEHCQPRPRIRKEA